MSWSTDAKVLNYRAPILKLFSHVFGRDHLLRDEIVFTLLGKSVENGQIIPRSELDQLTSSGFCTREQIVSVEKKRDIYESQLQIPGPICLFGEMGKVFRRGYTPYGDGPVDWSMLEPRLILPDLMGRATQKSLQTVKDILCGLRNYCPESESGIEPRLLVVNTISGDAKGDPQYRGWDCADPFDFFFRELKHERNIKFLPRHTILPYVTRTARMSPVCLLVGGSIQSSRSNAAKKAWETRRRNQASKGLKEPHAQLRNVWKTGYLGS